MGAVEERIESAHGPRGADTSSGHGFEPEVLAFCCEH
jgi:hypothetical protein